MIENDVRTCEKYALTIHEAAKYFSIGEKKLRSILASNKHLELFLQIGSKQLIKRRKFEEYLDKATAI